MTWVAMRRRVKNEAIKRRLRLAVEELLFVEFVADDAGVVCGGFTGPDDKKRRLMRVA